MLNLAKAAYVIRSLIQDPDLDIKFSGDKIQFTIYDCKIETDGNTYFKSQLKDRAFNIKIKTINELYQYVLVQFVKNNGLFKYFNEVVSLDELSSKEYRYLQELSENKSTQPQNVLNEILFTCGTPDNVSKIIGVSPKFIRKLRARSRHKILANAIINGNDQYIKSL